MADIFVSYRRDDSQWSAGRINDRLEAVFGAGRVFFDTVTTKPGEDFHAVLGNRVGSCRVLLAAIGPRWLDILVSRCGRCCNCSGRSWHLREGACAPHERAGNRGYSGHKSELRADNLDAF